MADLVTGLEVATPILGLLGLPDHVTRIELILDATAFVRIRCEFLLDADKFREVESQLTKQLAEYQLIKIDEPKVEKAGA